MAREEQPRENLIAEATALVERVELLLAGAPQLVVAGFRSQGSASLFFGEDPVYQFNSLGQLRRAFAGGCLYKASEGRLIEITRHRQGGQVQLASRGLSAAESAEFLAALKCRLDDLASMLTAGQVQVVAQVPEDCDVVARLSRWLAARCGTIEIASTPHAR